MEIMRLAMYGLIGIVTIVAGINTVELIDYFKTRNAVEPRAPYFREKENSVTFIGHATALIHTKDTNLLTDPNFNNWIVMFHRQRRAGMAISDLPKIDAILISHAHRDHLDEWSMKQFPKNTPVLISKGNGGIIRGWGFTDVREMEEWNSTEINGVKITAAPAKHSGARNSVFSDFPHALSYVAEGGKTVYFAGDTGVFDEMNEIGSRYKIDMALLPIGAFRPRQFLKSRHMNADDALQAMKMLGAKQMIPIHWGSFWMALDDAFESKDLLLERVNNGSAELKEKVHILENGDKYIIR